jgi:flagella basal body P-ring formation protein FlgA
MKNKQLTTQAIETISIGCRVQKWGRAVLFGLLTLLFVGGNVGETAEQPPLKISPISEKSGNETIEITQKMIEDMVMDFLNEKIPWEKNRVQIKIVQSPNSLMIPNRPYSYKVLQPAKSTYLGTVPLNVVFEVYGQSVRKVSVIVKISVETTVVVVQKPLNRNQIINRDDVVVVSMDMADLPSNYISTTEDVVGKRTIRTMNPKEVFRTDIIEHPLMVKKNDKVSIVAESQTIRITAMGEVRESGAKGDRIRVVNVNSNKEIFGRVLDSKTVQVEF